MSSNIPLEAEPAIRRSAIVPTLLVVSLSVNAVLWGLLSFRSAALDACGQRVEALREAEIARSRALERALANADKMLAAARALELNGCGRLLVPAVPSPQRWDPESESYVDPHGWYRRRLEALRSPLAPPPTPGPPSRENP